LGKICYRLEVLAKSLVGDASVVKRVDVLVVDLQDSRIILYRVLVLAELCKTVSPVVERFYVVLLAILDFKGVVLDRILELVHLAEDQTPV
jgi:hypothetical protein